MKTKNDFLNTLPDSATVQPTPDTSSQDIQRIAALSKAIRETVATADELALIEAAEALYRQWDEVEHRYSNVGIEQKEKEIVNKLGLDPSTVDSLVAELESLHSTKATQAAHDAVRLAKYRIAVGIQPHIVAVHDRIIAEITAAITEMKAIDLANLELSAEPAIERAQGYLNRIRAGRNIAAFDMNPTAGPMFSPRRLAGALIN